MTPALQIWSELAATPALAAGWNARRLSASSSAGILIAIRKPEDVPALLIEVSTTAVPPITEYPSAEGFQVAPESIAAGPTGRVRLCLILANERYRDVFGVLVEDVVADLRNRQDENDVVRGFLARLRGWQVFMRRHGPSPLPVEEQVGLTAELLFLRDRLVGEIPAQAAVSAWVGPLGAPQDFMLPQVAVEVKASASGIKEVQISSLAQLDTQLCPKPILLCWMDLVAAPAGVSLPQIISELRRTLSREDPAALRVFEERLLEVGYLDAHEKHYVGRLYRLRATTLYSVLGAFPRVERGEVREGVLSCSYVIGLSGCDAFDIPPAEADRLIRGGARD